MNRFIEKLEAAILRRNPLLVQHRLQPGLTNAQIKKELKRAGIEGAVEPITELYSWRNGCILHGKPDNGLIGGFVPPKVVQLNQGQKEFLLQYGIKRDTETISYHFIPLKSAILYLKESKAFGHADTYFPFLWDGSVGYIAVDIDPDGKNRVVLIQGEKSKDDQPLREAYVSFEEFLKDAIQANENNELLNCIRTPGKPITDESEGRHIPSDGVVASNPMAKKETIPPTENTLALRTDYSDEIAWKSLCAAIKNPDDDFGVKVDFIIDPKYDGFTVSQVPSLFSGDSPSSFAFIIDRIAVSHPDHPILVIDLQDKSGRTFRAIPSELGSVENNLSTANMEFDDFAQAVDKDGIFRGFK